MLLGEPPATPYDFRFHIGPIPIRVHPFFWLVTVLMGMNRDALGILTWMAACFLSILVHELGHAVAMRYYGESARIVLYGMGGLAISDGGYARSSWDYGRRSRRGAWQQILISAAGPGAGFLLAIVVIAFVWAMQGRVPLAVPSIRSPIFWSVDLENMRLENLVWDLLFINIAWGLVNLLPILPLDGGRISQQLLTMRDPSEGIRQALILSIVAGVCMSLVGFMLWHDNYVGFMFAWLAVMNYMTLQGS